MNTQLVRLDAPYNIICGKGGKIGLHIATLIVVKEKFTGVPEGLKMSDTLFVGSYPVVDNPLEAEGDVWTNTELKECLVMGHEEDSVSLYGLKKFMEYNDKHRGRLFLSTILTRFNFLLTLWKSRFILDTDKNGEKIIDYEVHLKFEDKKDGDSCMVYSTADSRFYFYEYFENEPPFNGVLTNYEAADSMIKLRDYYLMVLSAEGLRSITFSTYDTNYQWFVDRLNGKKEDE